MTRAVLALALGLVLVGSITLDHAGPASSANVAPVEVRLAALAPGSTGGPGGTAGAANVTGTLLAGTTDALFLDNTNATGAWHVRLEVVGSSGLANLATLTIGLDNGTRTAQVEGALGALTMTTGPHVRLAPGAIAKVYVTQAVTTLGLQSALHLRVIAADDATERAYVVTTANVTVR